MKILKIKMPPPAGILMEAIERHPLQAFCQKAPQSAGVLFINLRASLNRRFNQLNATLGRHFNKLISKHTHNSQIETITHLN